MLTGRGDGAYSQPPWSCNGILVRVEDRCNQLGPLTGVKDGPANPSETVQVQVTSRFHNAGAYESKARYCSQVNMCARCVFFPACRPGPQAGRRQTSRSGCGCTTIACF